MKHLFSTFVGALAVTATLSAATPQLQKQPAFGHAKTITEGRQLQAKGLKAQAMQATRTKRAQAMGLTEAKAPQRAAEATSYTANRVSFEYFDYDNDWYIQMSTDDYTFVFDIYGDPEGLVPDHVYTYADMLPDYAYCQNADTWERLFYTEATFLLTAKGDIYASVVCENGAEFEVSYVIPEISDYKTIEFSTEESDLNEISGEFQFVGKNELGQEAYCAMYGQVGPGVYEGELIDLTYTGLYLSEDDWNGVNIFAAKASVEAIEGGYKCTAIFDGMDGVEYTVIFNYLIPVGGETFNIAGDQILVDTSLMSWFGITSFTMTNDEYTVDLMIEVDPSISGTYGFDSFWGATIVNNETEKELSVIDGEVTIEMNGKDCKITGSLTGKDRNTYNLDFNYIYVKPEASETFAAVVDGALLENQIAASGAFMIKGEADDLYYCFTIYADAVQSGTYGVGEIDDYYSYIAVIDNGQVSDYLDYIDGEGTLEIAEDGSMVWKGVFMFQSETDPSLVVECDLTMNGKVQTGMTNDNEEEGITAEYDLNDCELDLTYLDEYGVLFVEAYNEDHTQLCRLQFNITGLDPEYVLPLGGYFIDDSEKTGTVTSGSASGSSIYGSFVGNLDDEGYIKVPLWFLVEGTVHVEYVEESLVITVEALNSYEQEVMITIYDKSLVGISNINVANGDVKKSFRNNEVRIVRDGMEYNAIGVRTK